MALDALTKLSDRGDFDLAWKSSVKTASCTDEPLALVFVDADKFKSINDKHGHQAGDAVLTGIAEALAAVVAKKGMAFRYGGEELVALLPNHTLAEALSTAERIRTTIERSTFGGQKVTVSIGVSVYPDTSSSPDTLLGDADKAMYDAKGRGRNLVRFFGEPEPIGQERKTTPERKQAAGARFSDSQAMEMRKSWFQRRSILCPDDGTPLRVHESNEIGSATPRLHVHCPLCGLIETI
jgi:diguanylate cyclase (GGDEF)-like protein